MTTNINFNFLITDGFRLQVTFIGGLAQSIVVNASPTQHDSPVTPQNVITTATNSPHTSEVNTRILSGRSLDIVINLNTNNVTLSTATGDPTSSVNLSKKKNIHCRRAKQLTLNDFLQVKDRNKLPSDNNEQQTLPVKSRIHVLTKVLGDTINKHA